jgi:hypothetical protein
MAINPTGGGWRYRLPCPRIEDAPVKRDRKQHRVRAHTGDLLGQVSTTMAMYKALLAHALDKPPCLGPNATLSRVLHW